VAGSDFCDYYELFQVSPTADTELIDYAYRVLAKRYHPDNPDTGDADQFRIITDAHRVLSDAKKREEFDLRRRRERLRIDEIFEEASSENFDVGSDVRTQQEMMELLYVARRRNVEDPGLGMIELETKLGCSQDQLGFHMWYLREKGWVVRLTSGLLALTADGVDKLTEGTSGSREQRLIRAGEADKEKSIGQADS
jgi:curved DNA-binding protein CbpA